MNPSNGKPKRPPYLLNFLTAILNIGSVVLVAFFVITYLNPHHPLNPFPPEVTSEPAAAAPSPTTSSTPLPTSEPAVTEAPAEPAAQVSPTPTITEPTATPSEPTPTLPPFPTATPVVFGTPDVTQTEASSSLYVPREETPVYRQHPNGCDGIYLAGSITDFNLNPVMLMKVRAEGILDGQPVFQEVLSGSSPAFGESGWEIKLSDVLSASTGTVTVALYPQGGWNPISEVVEIDSFELCSQNLIVVDFIQE